MPTIELTKDQVQLLFNLVNGVNWSGEQIENAYELKKVIKEAIDKNSIVVKKVEENLKS